MEEDGRNDAYSWETAYSDVLKIREILQEDEYGSVARSVAKLKFEQKREKYPQVKPSNVRMGLIRYVYIMIDCAECMSPKGIYPSRLNALNKTIFKFLDRFANQNPLSQMGIIVCKDKRAEKLVALTGTHNVVLEPGCFEGMLCNHIIPPIAQRNAECTVLRVGFPSHEVVTTPSFCLCHQSEPPKPYGRAFFCPQCGARYCSLPIECRVCKLLLVSALQLARSSIHITPLPPFQEAGITETEVVHLVDDEMKKLSKQRKIDKKLKRTAPIVGIKKSNPFDLKFNRVKCKIFDNIAKSNAHDGAPGLSRKAAIEKRASTLMNELKQLGKTNKIIDRRYGQKDIKISEEDRQMKRFAAERVNLLKQNRFQVTDEVEELTHKGCALTAIEKYDRTMCDDDDYDDGSGEIASDIVSSAHFGGGVSNSSNPTPTDKRLKRKEIIAEMITRTKGVRYEKRVLRDEREEMTDKLDETWSRLMKRGVMNNFSETKLLGLYSSRDKRGRASERVKTEQEISFEEKKKLESLEKQRLARMLSTSKSATGTGKDERSQKRFEVKYDDAGKLIDSQEIEKPHMLSIGYSDAEEVEHNDEPYEEDTFDLLLNESSNSDAETKNVPQTADDTVPFVFSIPDSYGIFKKYLEEKSSSKMELIFERMIKCYHPSLGEGNKKHLKRLFIYALRHFIDLSMQNNAVDMAKIDCICRNLYTLLKFDTYYAAHCVRAILRRQYALQIPRRKIFGFNTICLLRLVARLFPVTDIFHPVCTPALIFASKLLANVRIFSLKDAARVLILVATLLEYIVDSKRFVPEIVAFLYGLFLVAVENNTEERPPTVAFPISLRRMLVVEKQIEVDNPISSFSLDLNKVFSDSPTSFQDTDEHRCCILSSALAVLRSLFGIYSEHQSTFCIVFEPFARLIKILPMDKYPLKLRQILLETISELEIELNIKPSITQMQRSKAPKKLLELLEPRFDSEVESQRTTNKADGNSDRASLNRRYRKEVRSAIREIRKDSQFVARQKLSEQKENDRTRRQKTKALMHSLQVQESDYKKNQLTKSFD